MSRTQLASVMAALSAAVLLIAGCGASAPDNSLDPADEDFTTPNPGNGDPGPAAGLSIPTPEGAVSTRTPVTVMDQDGTPELCLGAVAESYPPQCGGPELVGWDWDDYGSDTYEEEQGTRWGQYVVRGTYDPDGDTFEVESATPGSQWEGEDAHEETDLSTPCEEPEDGWDLVDPELVSEDSMQGTLARAEQLPGHAGSWIDQSLNPVQPEDLNDEQITADERAELEGALNDPEYVIINVQVTENPETAYQTLREEWGGMLCVVQAEYEQAELEGIQHQVMEIEGAQSAGVDTATNQLVLEVTYDDGSLESQLHEIYGEGALRVSSRLIPAEEE